MYEYSLSVWLAFFYIYCVIGWIFESVYVSLKERQFINRGFMAGPWIPIYGSGAVMVLFVTLPVRDSLPLLFLVGMLATTLLEYVTGVAMERIFGVRYWDYSDQRFNFQGHICLSSSLAWGVMTVLLVDVLHPPLEQAMRLIDGRWLDIFSRVIMMAFTFDFAYAFRTALDLKEALFRAERLKKELQLMQKRLEVYEAVWGDSVGNAVEHMGDRVSNRVNAQRLKLSELTERRMAELEFHIEAIHKRLEAAEGMERLREFYDEFQQLLRRLEGTRNAAMERGMSRRVLRMMRRNPSAKSMRYQEEWHFIKERFNHKED